MSCWDAEDVVRVAAWNSTAVAAIVTSAVGASLAESAQAQVYWVVASTAGLGLAGIGNAMWLLRGRGAVGGALARATSAMPAPGQRADAAGDLVAAPGQSAFHRAGCPFVEGRPHRLHRGGRRTPCAVCLPPTGDG